MKLWMIPLAFLFGLIVASVGQAKAQSVDWSKYQKQIEWAAVIHQNEADNGIAVQWNRDWQYFYRSLDAEMTRQQPIEASDMYSKWLKGDYK